MVIDVDATTPGYVVLNDPYHAWWDAEVDGQEAPLLQANVIFRAVKVPAGAHRVRFVFRPFKGAWRDARRRWPWLDLVIPLAVIAGPRSGAGGNSTAPVPSLLRGGRGWGCRRAPHR